MSDEEFAQGFGGDDGSSDGDGGDGFAGGAPELPQGVTKEILADGEGWKKPKKGDEVEVHYVGTLKSDGSKFDSSRDRGKPFTFTLGQGSVIKGWDLGVATMLKGERATFTLEPEFAYGDSGSPPKIPAKATLVFEIELLGWSSKSDLFGDEGVIQTEIQEGTSTWKHPKEGEEVSMSIKATSEGGEVIEEKSDFDYVIGSGALGELTKVADKALLGMSKNQICSLACVQDYAKLKGAAHEKVTIEIHLKEIYATSDVSFSKDKSVMKKTIREGKGYAKPSDGQNVTLKVESATDGAGQALPGFSGPKELKFEVYSGEVCDALEGAVCDMKLEERAILTCTKVSKLAESQLGLSDVKADTIVLTMELTELVQGKEVWDMSQEEKVEVGMKRKEVGGKLFSAKRFELALEKYKKVGDAISASDGFPEELKAKAGDIKKAADLNQAACLLKLGDFEGVVGCCDKVLKDDKDNVKALFRRARARHELKYHLEAMEDLQRVLTLDPKNTEVNSLMQHAKRAQKLVDKQSKATFAKMCQGLGKLGADERTKKASIAPDPEEPADDFDGGEGDGDAPANDAAAEGEGDQPAKEEIAAEAA